MFNIPWIKIKYYVLNVVYKTLMYIKSINTTYKVIKLQLILQLNEHRSVFLDEKSKKLVHERMCN
jgi:hypothetical protein